MSQFPLRLILLQHFIRFGPRWRNRCMILFVIHTLSPYFEKHCGLCSQEQKRRYSAFIFQTSAVQTRRSGTRNVTKNKWRLHRQIFLISYQICQIILPSETRKHRSCLPLGPSRKFVAHACSGEDWQMEENQTSHLGTC